jgi:sulfide:quinone oxidoreductase
MDRRRFLQLAGVGGSALLVSRTPVEAQPTVRTSARIVIIGAGAAGTALANRLVHRLEGASITVIDKRPEHLYQPGLSLVAAGLKPASYVVSRTTDWLPRGITFVPEHVMEVDPVTRKVTTDGGQTLDYDYLIVAPGLVLDHAAIEGFSLDMVGRTASAPSMPDRTTRHGPGPPHRSSPKMVARRSSPGPRPR